MWYRSWGQVTPFTYKLLRCEYNVQNRQVRRMDLSAIQAAIASLKSATEISKAILAMKSKGEIQGKVAELQTALLEAHTAAMSATTAQFELQDKVRELEEKLRSDDEWSEQETRYSLVYPWVGPAQVYALKRSASEGEEPHLLCSNCFHNKRRVILNPVRGGNRILMSCPSCKSTSETGYSGIGKPQYTEEYEKEDSA